MKTKTSHLTQQQLDHRANQLNPNNPAFRHTSNHKSDMHNPNIGRDGTNSTYDKKHGGRGKHLNPNQKK